MNNFEKAMLTASLLAQSGEVEAKKIGKDSLENKNKIEVSSEATRDTSGTKEKTAQYETIIVHDENDPRLKAYQDSLTLHKDTRFYGSRDPDGVAHIKRLVDNKDQPNLNWGGSQEAYNRLTELNQEFPRAKYKNITGTPASLHPDDPDYFSVKQTFKKPKQKVEYQPKPIDDDDPVLGPNGVGSVEPEQKKEEPKQEIFIEKINPKYQEIYENPTGGNYERKMIGYKTQDKKTGKWIYYYLPDYEPGKNQHQVSEIKDLYIQE